MAVNVICISRSVGAGGEEVGRLVAQQLRLRFVDEEIIARAAEREGLDMKEVASAEHRTSRLARILAAGGRGDPEMTGFGTFAALGSGDPGSSEAYRELIKEAIVQTAEHGAVVIVAHAASHTLAGREDALRVFVTASPPTRSRRLATALGVDEQTASKRVKESDRARADYLRRFYHVQHELPTHYDLVVNTDSLSTEQAAALITSAATSAPHRPAGHTKPSA